MNRPPLFILPSTFNAEALLPRPLKRYGDDARYFVSTILRKAARGLADQKGYVSLRAEYLRNVMSFRHSRDVIHSLMDAKAICRISYRVGERCFSYRMDDRYLKDRHVRLPVTNTRLIRRIHAYAARAREEAKARILPVHEELARHQRKLEIDGRLAREILAKLPAKSNPFDVQGVLVRDIEERRFRLSVGRHGRVANSITNLKREVRSALRCGGDPLVGVDIACAQPTLLAMLMQILMRSTKNVTSYNALPCAPVVLPPVGLLPCLSADSAGLLPSLPCKTLFRVDFDRFADVCRSGELFSVLGEALRNSGHSLSRPELKRRFLADVLAKRKANSKGAEYPSPVEDVFRREFEGVWRFIRAVNCDGWEHGRLIRILQRLESWLVIEQVSWRFMTRYPSEFLITLHDAVYVRPRAVQRLIGVFHEVFRELDFWMTLKVEGQVHD